MLLRKVYKNCIEVIMVLACALSLSGCGEESAKVSEANVLIQELDYKTALEKLDEALEAGENIRLVERSKGIAYMGLTDYDAAIDAFQKSLHGSDGLLQDLDFDTNYYLAAAYMKNDAYAEAEAVYDAILSLRPEEKDAYFLRGNVRMHLDKYEEASSDFEYVLKMEPQNYDRLIAIYEVLDYFGYREAGQTILRTVLERNDKQMDNYVIGRIYYYLGEYQKACMALEESRSKQDASGYLYLGKSYEATGDYNYAASVYSSYLSKFGEDAQIYNQLGLCEMAKGEYEKALEHFQAGMQLGDSSVMQNLSFNEIVAYEYLRDFRQAGTLMRNYLRYYPDDEQAKREYDFLSTR